MGNKRVDIRNPRISHIGQRESLTDVRLAPLGSCVAGVYPCEQFDVVGGEKMVDVLIVHSFVLLQGVANMQHVVLLRVLLQ